MGRGVGVCEQLNAPLPKEPDFETKGEQIFFSWFDYFMTKNAGRPLWVFHEDGWYSGVTTSPLQLKDVEGMNDDKALKFSWKAQVGRREETGESFFPPLDVRHRNAVEDGNNDGK
jgi:hypothetical protein